MLARAARAVAAVAAAALLSSCATTATVAGDDPASRWESASGGSVDYQLGGASEPDDGVTVVVRDASEPPADGTFSICYLNGFQTQPGDARWWLDEHPELLLRDGDGEPMIDPGWPDEMALDTREPEQRAAIAAIVEPWVAGCAEQGHDAVEYDNLDSWTRFDGLTMDGNLALAALLVDAAHAQGMWAAQKNALDAGDAGPAAGFDLVVSEECGQYDECAGYAALYGDRHLDVEYVEETDEEAFVAMCEAGDLPALAVLRDRPLAPAGEAGHVRVVCP
ncbi:endo alpha-1,4 polygalactosaminidase [Agrococcus versicolor]|uniref:Endo alpha-1,4 polygalactosaminidase n=1 Tax=Agrococcus versicolor TaxID=501482 RepID=A0ABN3AUS4_9MICO